MEKILLLLFYMEVIQISEINDLLKVQWNVRYFSYKLRCMAVPGKEGNNPRTLIIIILYLEWINENNKIHFYLNSIYISGQISKDMQSRIASIWL